MRARLGTAAFCFACLLAPAAFADEAVRPPTLDCALGFDGLKSQIFALPGVQQTQQGGFDVLTPPEAVDAWRVTIAFTQPGHPAHPAAAIRTFRKQVTGVWTAESKGCGFGNSAQFAALMADMKAQDTQLTDASRADVERQKRERSPLAPGP